MLELGCSQGDGGPIEFVLLHFGLLDTREFEKCRSNVDVRSDHVGDVASWNPWSPHDQRDVDVFLEGALLSRLSSVLTDGVAIISGEEDVSLLEDAGGFQTANHAVDHFVNSLQSSETVAIPFVVVVYIRLVLLGQCENPRSTAWIVWIEVCRPRHFCVVEQVLVTFSWPRHGLLCSGGGVISVAIAQIDVDVHVAVRSNGCSGEKEWLIIFQGIVQKSVRLFRHNIRQVLAFVAGRSIMVALERGVVVLIREWIEKEVGACPSRCMWFVVIRNALGIKQLANIKGVEASILEPDR